MLRAGDGRNKILTLTNTVVYLNKRTPENYLCDRCKKGNDNFHRLRSTLLNKVLAIKSKISPKYSEAWVSVAISVQE